MTMSVFLLGQRYCCHTDTFGPWLLLDIFASVDLALQEVREVHRWHYANYEFAGNFFTAGQLLQN